MFIFYLKEVSGRWNVNTLAERGMGLWMGGWREVQGMGGRRTSSVDFERRRMGAEHETAVGPGGRGEATGKNKNIDGVILCEIL